MWHGRHCRRRSQPQMKKPVDWVRARGKRVRSTARICAHARTTQITSPTPPHRTHLLGGGVGPGYRLEGGAVGCGVVLSPCSNATPDTHQSALQPRRDEHSDQTPAAQGRTNIHWIRLPTKKRKIPRITLTRPRLHLFSVKFAICGGRGSRGRCSSCTLRSGIARNTPRLGIRFSSNSPAFVSSSRRVWSGYHR